MNRPFLVTIGTLVSLVTVATHGDDLNGPQVNSQKAVSTTATKGIIVSDPKSEAAKRLADKTRPRGTTFGPHPNADGRLRDLMSEIGRQFTLKNPTPPAERLEHFAPYFQDHWVNGWYGVIDDVAADADGWLVKVRVFPHLASPSATIVSTTDHYLETYRVKNGVFTFLGGAEPQGVLKMRFTD